MIEERDLKEVALTKKRCLMYINDIFAKNLITIENKQKVIAIIERTNEMINISDVEELLMFFSICPFVKNAKKTFEEAKQ